MDKDNTHIESEFIDHSWQEMSTLLDQEMPVKKRKRRLFWLFFFGIGLLGIIGLAYYTIGYPLDKEPALKSLTIQKEGKVATAKTQPNNNSHSSIDSKKVSEKQAPAKSSDDIRRISTNTAITKTHPTAAKTPTAVGTGPPTDNSKAQRSIPLKDKEQLQLTKNESKVANRFQTTLAPIATLPLNALSYNNHQSLGLTLPIIKKKPQKWRLGFYAGALAPKLGSFRAGLFTNVNLNRKWAIHFGLGYAKRMSTSIANRDKSLSAPLADIFEAEDMSTAAGASAAGNSTTTTNEVDLTTNSDFNYSNFHYLELPILFQYKVHPKISLELGGSIGYLYGYRYQYNGASIFTTNSIINNNTLFGTRTTNLSQSDIGTINRVNLTFISGINYQFSKNIVGYTNYQLSNKYLNTANISTDDFNSSQRWQQIEVGIRYYFK